MHLHYSHIINESENFIGAINIHRHQYNNLAIIIINKYSTIASTISVIYLSQQARKKMLTNLPYNRQNPKSN